VLGWGEDRKPMTPDKQQKCYKYLTDMEVQELTGLSERELAWQEHTYLLGRRHKMRMKR
jgi:hypothetical protein